MPESPNASPPSYFVAERLRVPGGGGRAAGPTPVGAGSRAATKRKGIVAQRPNPRIPESPNASPPHFVAERLRVPRGAGELRAPLPAAREAAPLQNAKASSRRGRIPECPNASPPSYFVAERLRVPTGGAVGCGPRSRRRGKPRRYKKAGPQSAMERGGTTKAPRHEEMRFSRRGAEAQRGGRCAAKVRGVWPLRGRLRLAPRPWSVVGEELRAGHSRSS